MKTFLSQTLNKLFLLLPLILAAACSNQTRDNSAEAILSQPPYRLFTDSLSREPDNAAIYARRGALLNKNNYPELAVNDFRKAWQLTGQEKYALATGNILLEKNPDSAIAFLASAIQKLPQSKLLPLTLAYAYDAKGNTAEALRQSNELLQRYPGELEALMLKASLVERQKDTASLAGVLAEAHRISPRNEELANRLAYLYAETRNPLALQLADELLRSDTLTSRANPYYVKGMYYANTGNEEAALRAFDETIRADYNYLNAYIEKGKILLSRKKNQEALSVFKLANTISPSFPDAYFWIGRVAEITGDKTTAKEYYQKAYGLDKTFREAKEAADRL